MIVSPRGDKMKNCESMPRLSAVAADGDCGTGSGSRDRDPIAPAQSECLLVTIRIRNVTL